MTEQDTGQPWLRLELDLNRWDSAAFAGTAAAVRGRGLRLVSWAALSVPEPDRRRRLYELNRACSADIPERGAFYSFAEYCRERIEMPGFAPEGVILAMDGDLWIGMTATSIHTAQGYAFSEMTGVLRPYRRQGVALALKNEALGYCQAQGQPWVRTVHHAANTAAISLNRRLGFVDEDPTRWLA